MLITKEDIHHYLPHGASLYMVHTLEKSVGDSFQSTFFIHAPHIWIQENKLTAYGIIENMAQTAALGLAWNNRESIGKPVSGTLASVSDFQYYDLPNAGETIKTEVKINMHIFKMYQCYGEVFCDGIKIANGEFIISGN